MTRKVMASLALAAAMLALSACGASEEAPPVTALPGPDCPAAQFQGAVGAPLEDMNLRILPRDQRIYPRGAPVTQDYRPGRINVEVDPDTNRVLRVFCG